MVRPCHKETENMPVEKTNIIYKIAAQTVYTTLLICTIVAKVKLSRSVGRAPWSGKVTLVGLGKLSIMQSGNAEEAGYICKGACLGKQTKRKLKSASCFTLHT